MRSINPIREKADHKLQLVGSSELMTMKTRFLLTLILLLACGLSSCTKEVTKYVAAPAGGGTLGGGTAGGGTAGGAPGASGANPGPAASSSTTTSILEGTINGGGGKGVLCRKNGKTTLETLDLYEARVLYGLKPIAMPKEEEQALEKLANILVFHFFSHDGPYQKQNEAEMERQLRTDAAVTEEQMRGASLVEFFRKAIREVIKESVTDRIRTISPNQRLKATNDSFEPVTESGCEVVQIAVYYDESVLLVDKTLWDQLDMVNRVSFYAHEWIYYNNRLEGTKTSVPARKMVGHLLSTKGLRPVKDGVPTEDELVANCRFKSNGSEVGTFDIFDSKRPDRLRQSEVQGMEVVFESWEGRAVLMRTSSFMERYQLKDIFGEQRTSDSLWWENIDLDVDTYMPTELIKLRLNKDLKGELQLKTRASTTPIATYDVECEPLLRNQQSPQPGAQGQSAPPAEPAAAGSQGNP